MYVYLPEATIVEQTNGNHYIIILQRLLHTSGMICIRFYFAPDRRWSYTTD